MSGQRDVAAGGKAPGEAAADEGPLRLYANQLDLTVTLAEVELDFGQLFTVGARRSLARIVTSPVHLARFRGQIADALKRYEATHGPLPPCAGLAGPVQ